MPYVMNCLPTQVSVQVTGKWFTFKPKEIKVFHSPDIARFIGQAKGEEGLVEIGDDVMELEKTDPARLSYIADKQREGVNKRIAKLEWQKHNLLASLRLDLETKGLKVDPLVIASKGDVAAIKELNALTQGAAQNEASNADILRKELGLDGTADNTHSGAANTGRTGTFKPTQA